MTPDECRSPWQLEDVAQRFVSALLEGVDAVDALDRLLREIVSGTGSAFGFLAEAHITKPDGSPYILSLAVTDISWTDEVREGLRRQLINGGARFDKVKSLYGAVLTTAEPVIANDPAHDPRAGGLPSGHPPLGAYLGVPVTGPDGLLGMVSLAGRPGGYTQGDVEALKPVVNALGMMIMHRACERVAGLARVRLLQLESQVAGAETMLDELLSELDHELRHPLTTVIGLADLMGQDDDVPAPARESARRIVTAGQHVGDILGRLRMGGQVGGPDSRGPRDEVLLGEVISECVDLCAPAGVDPRVSIQIGPDCDDVVVLGDRLGLRQSLVNLLNNAVRYTRPGTAVWVRAQVVGHRVSIRVIDSGPGVPWDALDRIFMPYERAVELADAVNTQGAEGRGIGLPLTRRLVAAMGGVLELEDTASTGSTFRIELDGYRRSVQLGFSGSSRARLLVLDDHPDQADQVVSVLAQLYESEFIAVAYSRQQAATEIAEGCAVLVSDYCFGDDGTLFDLLDTLQDAQIPLPPVVVVTSTNDPEALKALSTDDRVDDVVPKPVDPRRLLAAVGFLSSGGMTGLDEQA